MTAQAEPACLMRQYKQVGIFINFFKGGQGSREHQVEQACAS